MTSDYRLSRAVIVRLAGSGLAGVGALLLVGVLLGALLGWTGTVLTGLVIAAVVLVLVLAVAGVLVLRTGRVVRLDESGYEVRWVRGVGVAQGRWKDVEDVVADTLEGARVVVLRRRDGSTTTIPVDLLAARAEDFVRDLQQHLNHGHGYRPVR